MIETYYFTAAADFLGSCADFLSSTVGFHVIALAIVCSIIAFAKEFRQ